MNAAEGFSLACRDCDWSGSDPTAARCPECDGQLAPDYDPDAIDAADLEIEGRIDSQWDYGPLLPGTDGGPATLGEGATPLVDCSTLAEELEIGSLAIKDEGHSPTGTVADRACSVAITAAREAGATDVALPTTGADGVAAAAYSARADLDAHVFVPTRSTHTTKALVNVHDGDMSVVEGRLPDAVDAFRSAIEAEDWTPIDPANAPLRTAGFATLYPEIVADNGDAPDAIVVPTGHGEVLAGLHAAAELFEALGIVDSVPDLHAVQAEGCAPIVRAAEASSDAVTAWEAPDTIAGALEVPDPALGDRALTAVQDSGGSAVAVDDEAILASACRIAAAEGLEANVAGGAAAAGAWELAIDGVLDDEDDVVLLNTGAGSLDSDVLRSHLMRAG